MLCESAPTTKIADSIFTYECREFGVTSSQYVVLAVVKDTPGSDQVSISRIAGLDRFTTALVLSNLIKRKLIVRGQAHLLDDLKALADLERVRLLFDDLETRREVVDLLGRAELADRKRSWLGFAAGVNGVLGIGQAHLADA